jgi:hypothetical protein
MPPPEGLCEEAVGLGTGGVPNKPPPDDFCEEAVGLGTGGFPNRPPPDDFCEEAVGLGTGGFPNKRFDVVVDFAVCGPAAGCEFKLSCFVAEVELFVVPILSSTGRSLLGTKELEYAIASQHKLSDLRILSLRT